MDWNHPRSKKKHIHTTTTTTSTQKFIIKIEVKFNEEITMYEFKEEINVKPIHSAAVYPLFFQIAFRFSNFY